MPKRLVNPEWQLRRLPLIIGAGAILALGTFVLSLLIWMTRTSAASHENHQLICLLVRGFGLDHPISPAALARLTTEQKAAVKSLVNACPHGQ